MKRMLKKLMGVFGVLLVLPAAVPSAFAVEEDKVTGEAGLSAWSAYIWRGQEFSRHGVVFQPSVTLNYKGFTANVWGNLDIKPYAAGNAGYAGNYTETDLMLSYSRKFGIFQAGAGYIYYALGAPAAGAADPLDSQEVFLNFSLDTILAPTLTIYKEIDHYHQWYALLGISHTFGLSKMVSLKLAATASYLKSSDEATYPQYDSNARPTNEKYNDFHDGTLTVALPVVLTKSLSFTPLLSYVFPLVEDAGNEMKGRGLQGATTPSDRSSSYLYGGLTASFTF
jgi:hypothetical protein